MITRKTITFHTAPKSLNWKGDHLVDWVSGETLYFLNGDFKTSSRAYVYRFDAAIQSDNGVYAVLYEKLGTKGILLKNGEIIRELNRSYYQAKAYEYPISFLKLPEGEYALVHCPNAYNLIEIEYVESGEKITKTEERNPNDCFHSRFRVNHSNTFLLNTGWVWHPYGIIALYPINDGIKDNLIFDKTTGDFPTNGEICSAEFLSDDLLVVGASTEEHLDDEDLNNPIYLNPGQIGLFSIEQKKFLKKIRVDCEFGTLIPVDENYVIDLYEHPKLIDLNSGKVKQRLEEVYSGKQDSAIIHHIDRIPPIAISSDRKKIAIGNGNNIELLEVN